jgi:hypothetical protein
MAQTELATYNAYIYIGDTDPTNLPVSTFPSRVCERILQPVRDRVECLPRHILTS